MENIIYFLFIFFTNDALSHLRFDKRQIFSVFPESDLPVGALRLVVQHESLAGIITLILIAVLATGLLQFSLTLPVVPPNDYANADKSKEAQSIFINAIRVRMESFLLFHVAQMPVAGVPDRNRCRLHQDNAKQEVPGKKEFRQNKCILHTPDCRLLHNGAAKILWGKFR